MLLRPFALLLFLPWLVMLAACEPGLGPGPRLDLIGSTRFVSASRVLATPGDTLTSKLYTTVENADVPLKRVQITVQYEPQSNPLDYAALTNAGVLYANYPQSSLTYLDTTLAPFTNSFVFQTTYSTRTTSGRETWTFRSTDEQGRTAKTSFRLTLRNADSTLAGYHRYGGQLQAPRTFGNRTYLAALSGLTFPRFTARQNPRVDSLIDMVYVPAADNGVVLASPADPALPLTGWTYRRTTQFRATTLSATDFTSATTQTQLDNAFNTGKPFASATRTAILAKNQVIAFRTTDNRSGLLFVANLLVTPVPTLVYQVHIVK